jgi:thiamine biosynthesis lipoprotein
VALLLACNRPQETQLRFTAMGTLVDVIVYGSDPESAERAAAEVESLFHELHAAWDPWGEGELGRLNQAMDGGSVLDPGHELYVVLARAADLSRASGGRFDPAIGGLVRLWGFSRDDASPEEPPEADEITAELAQAKPLDAVLRGDGRIAASPGLAIDLGGFAKGVAVDRAIGQLRAAGVENAIVNAGGDLRAIGRHGDRPWRIGIRDPRSTAVLAVIEIAGDEAVFTSGDYERYFVHDGTRYHHILDPRSGWPAQHWRSVSVIAPACLAAGALSTIAMLSGAGAHDLLRRQGVGFLTIDAQNQVRQEIPA